MHEVYSLLIALLIQLIVVWLILLGKEKTVTRFSLNQAVQISALQLFYNSI